MFRYLGLVMAAAVLVAMLGLSPRAEAVATNSLAGSWAGQWSDGEETGSVSFKVMPNGSMTGTVSNDQYALTGTIAGRLRSNGRFSGTVMYAGEPPASISGRFTKVPGTVTRLDGWFVQILGGYITQGTFTVEAQRPHPLAGTWKGSWKSGGFTRGTIDFRIAVDGSSTGTVRDNTLGLNGTIIVQVNRQGRFTGTVSYNNGDIVSITGKIKKRANSNVRAGGTFDEVDGYPGGTFSLTKR